MNYWLFKNFTSFQILPEDHDDDNDGVADDHDADDDGDGVPDDEDEDRDTDGDGTPDIGKMYSLFIAFLHSNSQT